MQVANYKKIVFVIVSFLIVAFGQPVWSQLTSFLASTVGYALFFLALLSFSEKKKRFWLATAWFTAIQLVQFSWLLSHPYSYIITVYLLLSFLFGLQFGLIGLLIDFKKMTHLKRIFFITSCWVLLEWSRLFVLSGIAFNLIGLSLSANLYTLQTASLWGLFGMSYWVLLVNLLALKAWIEWPKIAPAFLWGICSLLPFLFGFLQLKIYDVSPQSPTFKALLIQPVFPIEEGMKFHDTGSFIKFVEEEWRQILTLAKEHRGKNIDLIALPEYIVPFATYTPVFNYEEVVSIFFNIFGSEITLPEPQPPLAFYHKSHWMVSNGYWLQSLANLFKAPVIAGMEDVEDFTDGTRQFYSSAQYVVPQTGKQWIDFSRYDKQILLPMGEYIPFSFCRQLAAQYGITGSFTPGCEAKIFQAALPFGVSICYEETFGHLMRENRIKGAELLVNLTSDAWYPTLAQQHCDHARLRTVENGMPLIRACNTGITCGFDCFGREIKVLGENSYDKVWKPGALYLEVPTFSFPTLYSMWGDYLIVALSLLGIIGSFYKRDL